MYLHLISIFYLTQLSNKLIICYDFEKKNSALPYSILRTLRKAMSTILQKKNANGRLRLLYQAYLKNQ